MYNETIRKDARIRNEETAKFKHGVVQWILPTRWTRRALYISLKGFVKKSDHQVGGLPVVRLTFRGVQPLTALVQRLSLRRITCPPPDLTQPGASGSVPDPRLLTKGGTSYSCPHMREMGYS
ncbi:hypothetical protein ANCDUO_08907 [Ancylostoma duodenale]|uniref:Uncharacterized protein n=1 Tax=Ancylostoma duodenale TaxID=51022 RepID=A0A0C2GP19_9BILA|nr:hypothetical protein ANCDUO_08907 [Ancylostoma duodenale]